MKKSCAYKGIAVRAASVALAVTLLGAMFVPMAGAASDKAAVTATVHIRNMPSTSGKSFGMLMKDTRVQLLWKEGDWYRVKFGSIEGYVRQDYLTTGQGNAKTGSNASTTKTNGSLPMGKIAMGTKNSEVATLQSYLASFGFYAGAVDGIYGSGTDAALRAFQRDNGLAADGICGTLTRQKLQSSQATNSSSGTVSLGDKGASVTKLQKALRSTGHLQGGAVGVFGQQTLSAVKAFQKAKGLSVDGICGPATWAKLNGTSSSASTKTSSSVSTASAARIELGDSGSGVKTMQSALKNKGYYSGSVDGKFGKLTDAALRKFQRANGLSADGVFGPASQQKLLGKLLSASTVNKGTVKTSNSSNSNSSSTTTKVTTSKAPSGVELIPWSEAKSWYKVGAVAKVYDIGTGITFNMYRFSGSVHADVEPYTKSDTAKMKQAFGGSWKWTPRPVLVTYNGRTSAASLNGMPHGGQTITNNGMDGQVCIHFLNSTTHNSASTKHAQDHQNAVQRAWAWAKKQ